MSAIFRNSPAYGWCVISDKSYTYGQTVAVTLKSGERRACTVTHNLGEYSDPYVSGYCLLVSTIYSRLPPARTVNGEADISRVIAEGGGKVDLSILDAGIPAAPQPKQQPQRQDNIKGGSCKWFQYLDID